MASCFSFAGACHIVEDWLAAVSLQNPSPRAHIANFKKEWRQAARIKEGASRLIRGKGGSRTRRSLQRLGNNKHSIAVAAPPFDLRHVYVRIFAFGLDRQAEGYYYDHFEHRYLSSVAASVN
jgi:hypothetical protein